MFFTFFFVTQNVQMSSKITIPSPTLIFLHNVTQKELILSYAHYILRTRGGLSSTMIGEVNVVNKEHRLNKAQRGLNLQNK